MVSQGGVSGGASAMNNLGVMYQNGQGVTADPAEAIEVVSQGGRSGLGRRAHVQPRRGLHERPRST